MFEEIWKSIVSFEGLYEVSNYGRVRSLDKKVRSGNRYNSSISVSTKKGKILKQVDLGLGYLVVCLRKEGKNHQKYVHRLVAEAFIPNPLNLSQVNHKDENKQNNCVGNLEWCSPKYNCNYGTRNKRVSSTKSGKYYPKESRQGRRVAMFSLSGVYERDFNTITEAMQFLKKTGSSSNISGACSGKLKTAYKHLWKYL